MEILNFKRVLVEYWKYSQNDRFCHLFPSRYSISFLKIKREVSQNTSLKLYQLLSFCNANDI